MKTKKPLSELALNLASFSLRACEKEAPSDEEISDLREATKSVRMRIDGAYLSGALLSDETVLKALIMTCEAFLAARPGDLFHQLRRSVVSISGAYAQQHVERVRAGDA